MKFVCSEGRIRYVINSLCKWITKCEGAGMEGYLTYEEFLGELAVWGDAALQEHPKGWDAGEVFLRMWERSEQGA